MEVYGDMAIEFDGVGGGVVVCCCLLFFFFQAEDGIRDVAVTGVQTCALPIWWSSRPVPPPSGSGRPSCSARHPVLDTARSGIRWP